MLLVGCCGQLVCFKQLFLPFACRFVNNWLIVAIIGAMVARANSLLGQRLDLIERELRGHLLGVVVKGQFRNHCFDKVVNGESSNHIIDFAAVFGIDNDP